MHSQPLPAIEPSPGSEGGCGGGSIGAPEREDFSQKINLDLAIGSCASENEGGLKKNEEIKQAKRETLFTASQFHEFFNQILVCNSITSGLPVPVRLFVPSLIGVTPLNCDHSRMMDSEPGRCRRTDGRKWRCSKSVVPNQKYCQRHMHRGRRGSRKHVEPNESVSRTDSKIVNDNRMPLSSLVTSDIDSRRAASDKGDLNPTQPCCGYSNGVPSIVDGRSNEKHDALLASHATILGKEVNKNISVDHPTTSFGTNSINNGATDRVNHAEGKESSSEKVNCMKTSRRKESVTKNNYLGFLPPGFGLSPKSILHCSAGKVSLGLGRTNYPETELQRCRRTDGKKWQCRQDAVPGQKYCKAHMYRGAKRFMLNPESTSNEPVTSDQRSHISGNFARHLDNDINLNSMPASPQHTSGNNSTSSSSDATTITDENFGFCLNQSTRKC